VERHHAVSMSTSLLDVSPNRHKLQTTPLPPPSLGYHNNNMLLLPMAATASAAAATTGAAVDGAAL